MIKRLDLANFRSVREAHLDLLPLNFLYGKNAAGKSSVFYALNVFRNAINNTNQKVDGFFNLSYLNLGSFKSVVTAHDDTQPISVRIHGTIENSTEFEVGMDLHPATGEFILNLDRPYKIKLQLPVTFPYPANGNVEQSIPIENGNLKISWSGVLAQVTSDVAAPENQKKADNLTKILNQAVDLVRGIDVVPLMRGFTGPTYGIVSFGNNPVTQEEISSLLSKDDYLEQKVSIYLEEILGRQFRVKQASGASVFGLVTIDKDNKRSVDLVNDGFGINQMVYLLAKVLNQNADIICIEEPEINLHPGIVRMLPEIFAKIVKDEKKQLIISTHSEVLIQSMLSSVAAGNIKPKEVACYLTKQSNGNTVYERQKISRNGQIDGGLRSFMEEQLSVFKKLFNADQAPESEPMKPSDNNQEQVSSEDSDTPKTA